MLAVNKKQTISQILNRWTQMTSIALVKLLCTMNVNFIFLIDWTLTKLTEHYFFWDDLTPYCFFPDDLTPYCFFPDDLTSHCLFQDEVIEQCFLWDDLLEHCFFLNTQVNRNKLRCNLTIYIVNAISEFGMSH